VAASSGRKLALRTDGEPTSQIALTRLEYSPAAVTLSILKQGNNVVLTWPTGTLQQSGTINGTFTDVAGAQSPYPDPITGTAKFYRVKLPQ
jgi:hypothetical protein